MDKEEKEQHIEVFLNNCKILASWAKDEIKRAIGSEGNKCYLNLAADSRHASRWRVINDEMMDELLQCIGLIEGKVKVISLTNNNISSTGASMLFEHFTKRNETCRELYLDNNKAINDTCMESLGEFIKSNKYIEAVYLKGDSITDAGIEIITPYLIGNANLKNFDVFACLGITDKSLVLLMQMIESSHLEILGIGFTSITNQNTLIVPLVHNVIKHGSRKWQASYQNVFDATLIGACKLMKNYGISQLKEIECNSLSGNIITSKGAIELFHTLVESNSVVSSIDMSFCRIDDTCMKVIGEFIRDNESIEILLLANNRITDKGIETLSSYLIGNITFKCLDLKDVKGITDASLPYLIEVAKKTCIEVIDLDHTSMHFEKQQEINMLVSRSIDQREVPIQSNSKSAAKISA